MDMPVIEMPKAEARQHFLDYRRAVRERHNAEDEMIMRGYRALSQGHQVINLLDVMKAGGIDAKGRPKLAVARADLTRIRMDRDGNGAVTFHDPMVAEWRRSLKTTRFPDGTLDTPTAWSWPDFRATAMVPNIPPALRPASKLENYHILWEAEWSKAPPFDPALLKHCGGWLYVVLATWDLTPLEQAVLGLTRN